MSTAEWTIELPAEWRTAPFWEQFIEVVAEAELPRGRRALVVLAMLQDGTNVLAMTWDRGTRLARSAPAAWGVEERFTGRPPGPGEGSLIRAWQVGIDCMVKAAKAAAAEEAVDPARSESRAHAVYCVRTPDALDKACEAFSATSDALTREEFDAAVLEASGLPPEMAPGRTKRADP